MKQSLDKEKAQDATRHESEHSKEEWLRGWLNVLNSVLHRKPGHPGEEAVGHTELLSPNLKVEWDRWWPTPPVRDPERPETLHPKRPEAPQQLRHGRRILDGLLQRLGEESRKAGVSVEPDAQKEGLSHRITS
jgi:hypothetical protein